MQILHVTPIARSITTEVLTYFSVKAVEPGTIVTVPLRKQKIKALVVSGTEVTNMKILLKSSSYQIRNIHEIHDEQVFSPHFLNTCNIIKDFYATNTGKLINLISPSFILKNMGSFNRPKDILVKKELGISLMQKNYSDRVSYYKTLLREKMLREESLHIICPTQQNATDLFNELEKNNENTVHVLHSKITKKKTKETFETLHNKEKSSCLISTPGYIDTYLYKKSVIIIENENSEFYRPVAKPFIDMREFIIEYAKQLGIECVIATSVLRPESWYRFTKNTANTIEPLNKKIFKSHEVIINNQHQRKPGKQTDLQRIQELDDAKSFSCISRDSIESIKIALKNNERIFIFSHKKSLAPSIICKHCGNMARSSESGFPYSLYIKQNHQTKIKERIFICQNSGEKIPAFDVCQFCDGHHLITFGIGTERIYEELCELFPDTQIQILDANSAKTKKSLTSIVENHAKSTLGSILVGTQKALPYIKGTDTSIITSLDSYFMRMSHNTLPQVISLVKEITEKTSHPVIIQSRNILESYLPILKNGLFSEYIDNELEERKKFNYPPFSTLIVIKRYTKKEFVKKNYYALNNLLDYFNPQILIQPGNKRDFVELVCVIQLDIKEWNNKYQNPKLQEIIFSFDRSTDIFVNPKDII
jgi:primosomal protein N' (replication factor Y)